MSETATLNNSNKNITSAQTNGHSNGNHGNDVSHDTNAKTGSNGKVPEKHLPPGMNELVKECFAPGMRGYFERRTNLPLLKSTNLAILTRRKSKEKRKQYTSQSDLSDLGGDSSRVRCNSIAADFQDCNDLFIVRACWEIILSFMGDEEETLERGQSTRLFESTILERRKHFSAKKKIWRKPSNSDVTWREKTGNRRVASMYVTSDYNGNGDVTNDVSQSVLSHDTLAKMTVLEKVRFLINVGLENTHFRDEIYCEILKQLVCNSSPRSSALGWILLSLVMGCFAPSDKILDHVKEFLCGQRTACSMYCIEKLSRTLESGDRKNPPCSLELQAAKSRQKIRLPVICMDHSVRTIWTDSSTTAQEMCSKMASKNRMGDNCGFSLYLALDNKLVTLGSGNFHIMDAISQAERFSKLNDVQEIWRIYYRREYFSKRDASGCQGNQMKAWLTYSQICGGVQSGEYQCTKAQDLALLMAHQYCVRHGLDVVDMKRVIAVCDQSLPLSVYADGKKKKWCQMVHTTLKALQAKTRSNEKVDTIEIMQQVVRYASKAFIANFTKTFFLSSFQEIGDFSPCLIDLTMKINHEMIVIRRNGATRRPPDNDPESDKSLKVCIDKLKRIELVDDNDSREMMIKLTISDGRIFALGSSQAREIATILERYICEIFSDNKNESNA